MKNIEAAEPRIVFDESSEVVEGWIQTLYQDATGRWIQGASLDVDPHILIEEYRRRSVAVMRRNPDMPKRQAIEVALLQWALELVEKR